MRFGGGKGGGEGGEGEGGREEEKEEKKAVIGVSEFTHITNIFIMYYLESHVCCFWMDSLCYVEGGQLSYPLPPQIGTKRSILNSTIRLAHAFSLAEPLQEWLLQPDYTPSALALKQRARRC